MENVLTNDRFAAAYERLGAVSLNPRRHTASNARTHSDAVAKMASRLGAANGRSADEIALLSSLGHAHDIGKVTGTAQPARSLDVLAECGVTDSALVALVKWHDTNLPWHRSMLRGEAPSEKAWRRLANDVDIGLLCLFMVADRVDAPGGWRRNAPATWFLAEAAARGLVRDLVLDIDDHPSEVCAGAVLVDQRSTDPAVLLIRVRAEGWELPKGGIDWDELPEEAAVRELLEESGVTGEHVASTALGHLEYFVGEGHARWLKRVRYFLVPSRGDVTMGALPSRTRERAWLRAADIERIPLVNEELRTLLRAAIGRGGRRD